MIRNLSARAMKVWYSPMKQFVWRAIFSNSYKLRGLELLLFDIKRSNEVCFVCDEITTAFETILQLRIYPFNRHNFMKL